MTIEITRVLFYYHYTTNYRTYAKVNLRYLHRT